MPRDFCLVATALLTSLALHGCGKSPEPSKSAANAAALSKGEGGSPVITPAFLSARRWNNAARMTFDASSTINLRDFVVVWVKLTNHSSSAVPYTDREPREMTTLTDQSGKRYVQMTTDSPDTTYNRVGVPILAGEGLAVPFAFEPPPSDAGRLTLAIPAENFRSFTPGQPQLPGVTVSFNASEIQ